ncbi:MAG: outer membrane protein assembly factor BamA [Candidatus Binatia bacterium]
MIGVKTFAAIVFLIAGGLVYANTAYSVTVDTLDVSKDWRVEKINLSGLKRFTEGEMRDEILTKERPWYRFWGERPAFEPVTFEHDLERLRRYYEARGYYDTVIEHDLLVDEDATRVTVEIRFKETLPVVIYQIDVAVISELPPAERPPLPESLPVKRGEVFAEAAYQEAEQALRGVFSRQGFAHVESSRKAEIRIDGREVDIGYTIKPGPPTIFGATDILGADSVNPSLIQRELAYGAGEKFSSEKVAETRAKLLGLDLFSSVRIGPKQTAGQPAVVPMEVEVAEKPHREVRMAVGYSTEEEFRTQAQWRHLNWLGGGRQLSLQAKYSSITMGAAADLVQPHFFTPRTKGVLSFKLDQEEEQTYLRNMTRFMPRVDHQFTSALSGFIGYRLEYDTLKDIAAATERALGDIKREGLVSGPAMGLVWNTTDNPFYPKKGEILSLTLEQAGVIWGGAYKFFKITGEAKKYYEIGWETILASRLKVGLGDAIGAEDGYPLFERYYAGGEKSVRGYGRRRLGPITDSNDPLGGLSLLEGSIELRRPIWRELGGALFVDFGQVAPRPFDVRIANLNFSAGFGLSYTTPVGPVRLDIGFPFQKPPKDQPWQIHFSIGAFF